jgi:TPR repeat protein
MFFISIANTANAGELSAYTDQHICRAAIEIVNGSKKWRSTTFGLRYKAEARKRGLNCPRMGTKSFHRNGKAIRSPTTTLQNAFNGTSKQKRKIIQTQLSNLGFYQSSIDGLYGRGTAAALKKYNKDYLGNANLGKASNAKALIADLLKETPTIAEESKTADIAEVELEKPKIPEPEPEPEPPLDFAQIKTSYEAKEFSKAFANAQVLAIQGDTNAQFYLGKMYADGRGTIQVSTAAHMWFNIASMNGSDEAYEQRKAVTAQMTANAIEKAQAMAMTCIQSEYSDCGLTIKPAANKVEPVAKTITELGLLKSHFKEQPLLKRKQIQYALKKLGVYSSSVDGAWGKGTATAVSNYQNIQEMQTNSPSELFASVLSKVEAPSFFAEPKTTVPKKKKAQKKKATTSININSGGLTAIVASPSMSGTQALAVCKPQASLAKSQASSGYQAPSYGNTVQCTGYGRNINCNSSANSGGFAGAFASGLAQGIVGKKAYANVLNSCLASYGWRE